MTVTAPAIVQWKRSTYRPGRQKRPKSHLCHAEESRSVCGRGTGLIGVDFEWGPQCRICLAAHLAIVSPASEAEAWFPSGEGIDPLAWSEENPIVDVAPLVNALYEQAESNGVIGFTVVQVHGTDEDGFQHLDIVRQPSLAEHTAKLVYQVTRTAWAVELRVVGDTVEEMP